MNNKESFSTTEERLIEIEEKLNDLSEELSKTTFTSIVNGMILEDIFFKLKGKQKDLDRYYEEAKQLTTQYYEENLWGETTPGEIEELDHMLSGYESKLLHLQQREQRYIKAVKKASEKLEGLEQLKLTHQQLKNWVFGFIDELKEDEENEQRLKKYLERYPIPTDLQINKK